MENLKQVISLSATLLITLNGKTSTLELKNCIHFLKPECGLTQSEVSVTMDELARDGYFSYLFII